MKLNEILNKITDPKDWTLRFNDETNGILYPTTANVSEIYTDWFRDCEMCPENGEIIFGIQIQKNSTGECYLIETDRDFDFESLMRGIESNVFNLVKQYEIHVW